MTTTPHIAISTDPIPTTLAVTHVLRRDYDHSLISAHCCENCATLALHRLTMAAIMGDNPPGPLELARVHVIEVATGAEGWFTTGLVPLDGIPPVEPESTFSPWM